MPGTQSSGASLAVIEISDPVSGFRYALDTQSKVAHREKLPAPHMPELAPGPRRESRQIQLGEKLIEGELATGTRRRTEIGRSPNGQAVFTELEVWQVPSLHLGVLTHVKDAASGTMTWRIINLKRGEPDPKLFELPADYRTVDATRPFEINYTRP